MVKIKVCTHCGKGYMILENYNKFLEFKYQCDNCGFYLIKRKIDRTQTILSGY